MKKLLILTIGLTLLVQSTLVSTASAQSKSFAQWCQQKSSVPAATRHTIDVLLKKAATNNCQAADSKLRSLTRLELNSNRISDVKPLAALTNLKALLLNSNQISDVKPLAALTNLDNLALSENRISDIKPLAGLTKLTNLFLKLNPISAKVCPVEASACMF